MADDMGKSCDKEIYLTNTAFIKGILLLMVILGHSIAYWASDWFTGNALYRLGWAVILFQWLSSFHVFGFALVSGYIFASQMEKGMYCSYFDFFKKKVKRLLIPYIFVAAVWVIPVSLILLHWDGMYILNNFILGEGPSQLWFLWMLFDVFILAKALWKFISQNVLIGWGVLLHCISWVPLDVDVFQTTFVSGQPVSTSFSSTWASGCGIDRIF